MEILLCMAAKTKPLHERHRCCIERRNGTTSVGSDAKPSPKVWQLQFHVHKTAKDSSPFAMSVSCTFSAKRLQNRGIYFCKERDNVVYWKTNGKINYDVRYEGCWSIAPKKSKTSVLAETQHLMVNETVRYNVELTTSTWTAAAFSCTNCCTHSCQWVPLRHAAPSWRCQHPCLTDMRAEDWPAEHFEKEHVHDRRR